MAKKKKTKAAKAKATKPLSITLEVEDVTDQLFLRTEIGEGEFEGEKFCATSVLPTHSPHIQFRGKCYLIGIQEIMKAVCGAVVAEAKGE